MATVTRLLSPLCAALIRSCSLVRLANGCRTSSSDPQSAGRRHNATAGASTPTPQIRTRSTPGTGPGSAPARTRRISSSSRGMAPRARH